MPSPDFYKTALLFPMVLPQFMPAAASMTAMAAARTRPAALSCLPIPDYGADGQTHRRNHDQQYDNR